MNKKLIILIAFAAFTFIIYLCKDWLRAMVPDNDYSDRVIHNKEIFILILAIIGFIALFCFRKKKK